MDSSFNDLYSHDANTSLVHCLGLQHDSNIEISENVTLIKKSPYCTIKRYKETLRNNTSMFSMISINIHSLNAKFDELQVIIDDINNNAANRISAIFIQETWLSEKSDVSLLNLVGYNLISQCATCSRHGGLAIFLDCDYDYVLLPLYKQSHFWEGQFIEISSEKNCNKIMIGNIYRKPIYTNESYQLFLNDLIPILYIFNNSNGEAIIAGDFNINLLKLNEKHFISDYFDTMLCKNFYPQITSPTRLSANQRL